MPRLALSPLVASLAALVATATLCLAAIPEASPEPGGDSIQGLLLVATPEIGDPRFAETVILMVRQDKSGAIGIAINRPVEERSLASLLDAIGDHDSDAKGTVRIFAGGPVDPQLGFVLHSAEYHTAQTIDIGGHIALTASPVVLRDMGRNAGPEKTLVAFGYSGWGPGQLEQEMAQNAWFTEPADPKLVFDEPREKVWKEALARRSRAL